MKTIPFTKMSGAGNDFIIVDATNVRGMDLTRLTKTACERTDGIGADGLLIIDKSKRADYRMRIINADGSEAEMCGNGARCLAAYIVKNKKPKKAHFTLDTLAGVLEAYMTKDLANVHLSDPQNYRPNIKINLNERDLTVHYIDTGVPHTIVYVDNLHAIDVYTIGHKIRNHEHFKPRGTNVNFLEQINDSLVEVRTYERGVEDETKACGTGAVASGIITYLKMNPSVKNKSKAKMNVKTKSGEVLEITFDIKDAKPTNVWLKGSAKFIAEGKYFI